MAPMLGFDLARALHSIQAMMILRCGNCGYQATWFEVKTLRLLCKNCADYSTKTHIDSYAAMNEGAVHSPKLINRKVKNAPAIDDVNVFKLFMKGR
jgi:protein-arginine kinase activator protein McsA